MKDDRPISRRDSLKRIAAGGAIVGGGGVALSSSGAAASTSKTIDTDKLNLVAICHDETADYARFRVDNDNKTTFEGTYDLYDTDHEAKIHVPAKDTRYFDVSMEDGVGTVRLFYDGEQIDVTASNTEETCPRQLDPKNDLTLKPVCYAQRAKKESLRGYPEGKFYIYNDHDQTVNVRFRAPERNQFGGRHIPANGKRAIWIDLGPETDPVNVTLHYDGTKVDEAKAETNRRCDKVEKDDND